MTSRSNTTLSLNGKTTMTNTPDLSVYHDLRIYDRDPQAVFDAAVQNLRTRLPEWEPREDSTEIILLESLALEVSEAVFAINRLPGTIMSILMQKYGINRDEGAYPRGRVTISMVNTFGYTIEAGTRMLLNMGVGTEPLVMTVDDATVVPVGATSVTVEVTGDRYTAEANGVPEGTVLEFLDAVVFVERAVLAEPIFGGRDPESDMEWSARGISRLRRLSDVLVTANHFEQTALENPNVVRAKAVDLYNPLVTPSDNKAGHITVTVYGEGAPLTPEQKTELKEDLSRQALASLTVHVADPVITTVNVTVEVRRHALASEADVRTRITDALRNYLNPGTWQWSGRVRVNELISLIDNVDGVDYVQKVLTPATDVVLSGPAPLVKLGTVQVKFV